MMKAKEYYEKYKDQIIGAERDNRTDAYHRFVIELNEEAKALMESRHVKRDSAFWGVIKEINAKWNAISRMFEKEYGASPLRKNGFLLITKELLARHQKEQEKNGSADKE